MVKGGRDEEKVMGPLFPRLHVSDAEKGGPRAPPRNKMALYEQLSIPSQRFSSSNSAMLLPPHNSNLVPSASSSQDFPKLKNLSSKKCGDDEDFRVPTFDHPGTVPYSCKDQNPADRERQAPFYTAYQGCLIAAAVNTPQKSEATTCNTSIQLQNIHDKPLKRTNTTDLKSRQYGRNQSEQRPKEPPAIKDSTENSASPDSHPSAGEKITEASTFAKTYLNQDCLHTSLQEVEHSCNGNIRPHQESGTRLLPEDCVCGDCLSRGLGSNGVAEKDGISRVRSESYTGASLGNSHRSPNRVNNYDKETEDRMHRSLQLGDVDRNDDVSDTSMVDSISGLDISPDDIVGVIGQKHFLKARRAIVNQQRLFAVQVFELHRLIKVQKLIAGSPHLLLEGYPYLSSPPRVTVKKLSSEYILKPRPQVMKRKDDSQKPSQKTECLSENAVGKPLPLPSLNDGVNKGHVSQFSGYGPYPGHAAPGHLCADNRAGSCHLPPPGNQWLVPVMSPSEGLVYKPYAGSCPPAGGIMAPVFGGCVPISIPPGAGDFMTPAYGVPAAHQQPGVGVIPGTPTVAQSYYSPYRVPVTNPVISASGVEQVNSLAGNQSHGKDEKLSVEEVSLHMHSRSSCNVTNQKSEAFSSCVWKAQAVKDSELQGTSSPCERVQRRSAHVTDARDALSPFPTASATDGSNQTPHGHSSDQQSHVIKVVPHNARSATESAARIFRSIQEERHQHDSL